MEKLQWSPLRRKELAGRSPNSSRPKAHKGPASSWTDTEEYRGEIRRDAQQTQQTLKKLIEKQR
jgi:hypothetical protein